MTQWVAIVRCRDCTDVDDMGCNDGRPWTLGPFDSPDEAEEAGHDETDDCSPWWFTVTPA